MDVVVLRGSARERGLQQGRLLCNQIRASWENYLHSPLAGTHEDEFQTVLGNMLRFLESHFPEVLEELYGVGEGSGLDFDAVVRWNFASAIWTTILCRDAPTSCSAVAFTDAPEGAIVGKNTDLGTQPEYYALKVVIPDCGIPYMGYGQVGGPWVEAAINAEGLVIAQASAPTQPNQDGYGMPCLHSSYLAMQRARRVQEAIDFLGEIVHAGKGSNWMLADIEGTAVAVERGHDRQMIRTPEDGQIYFTNHFLTTEMEAVSRPGDENSLGRITRYRAIFADEHPEHTLEGLRQTIADHGHPVGPCQHGPLAYTRYACLLIPQRHEMRLFRGPACTTTAESYFI